MTVFLAKIELSEPVQAAVRTLSEAVRKPSAVEIGKGKKALRSLVDSKFTCAVPWDEWESVLSCAKEKSSEFQLGFLLGKEEIDLLLDTGLPEAARPVFVAAKNAGAAVLQCFEENEE